MKIFEIFKRRKDDDVFDFPQLKPMDVKEIPLVLERKEEEKIRDKYHIQSHKRGCFIEMK